MTGRKNQLLYKTELCNYFYYVLSI